MSRFSSFPGRGVWRAALLAVLLPTLACAEKFPQKFSHIGRPASIAELAAWDIDVRPDFAGLPAGSGSVAQGAKLWEAKCALCHGVFGESQDMFPPLVGGTTRTDIERGRVAALSAETEVPKTTMMKLATVSTLWDYIRRAMPFDAPKSLTVNEVYAATAYILHLADIVPADFILSEQSIASVQQRLPNRNGMTTQHGMLHIDGKPDVASVACMKDCPVAAQPASVLPGVARVRNGNLANQNRPYGAVRGVESSVRP